MTIELEELFASNMRDRDYYLTIELLHSAFRDADDNPTSWRFVTGFSELTAGLELTAPLNAGELVVFSPMAFSLDVPMANAQGRYELALTIDGASGEIVRQLELQAEANREQVKMILREYTSTDLSEPEPGSLQEFTVLDPSCTPVRVQARAIFSDPVNQLHPNQNYTRETHPGLST